MLDYLAAAAPSLVPVVVVILAIVWFVRWARREDRKRAEYEGNLGRRGGRSVRADSDENRSGDYCN